MRTLWSQRIKLLGLLSLALVGLSARVFADDPQALVYAEYFWDTDPGLSNGVPVSITKAESCVFGDPGGLVLNASVTNLSSGLHRLGFRVVDASARWSDINWLPVQVQNAATLSASVVPAAINDASELLVAAEYFWDTDPGNGNGTAVSGPAGESLTAGAPGSSLLNLDTTSLAAGLHKLGFRTKNASATWSDINWLPVQVQNAATLSASVVNSTINDASKLLVAAEYFWDTDPGNGNGTAISVPAAESITLGDPGTNLFNADITSLTAGVHQLGVRAKAAGNWGGINWLPVQVPGTPWVLLNGQYYSNNLVQTTNGASFQMTLQSKFPNATIFFTTDGTDPNGGGAYSGPINVTAPFSIRAVAYNEDFTLSSEAPAVVSLSLTSGGGGNVSVAVAVNPTNGVPQATLTAAPLSGWNLIGWNGDGSGTNTVLTLTIDGPKAVQATFGTTLTTSGTGLVQLQPALALYPYGSTVQLTAAPTNSTTYFRQWGGAANGQFVNPLNFVVINATQSISAVFFTLPGNTHSLTVFVNGFGNITKSPQQSNYTHNASVTLTAAPQPGSVFVNWTGDTNSALNPLNLFMDTNKTVTANFSTNAQATNFPPNVAITNPITGAVFTAPASVVINATAGDSDGTVARVVLLAGTNTLATLTNAPYNFTWTNAPIGTNFLTAIASDNGGAMATSAPVVVTMNLPPPGPPVFSMSTNGYSVSEDGGSVTVTILKSFNSLSGTVTYSTVNGSALENSSGVGNYQAVAGALNFAASDTNKTVSIPIVYNSGIYEGDTTFSFLLLGSSGNSATVGSPSGATITIREVDQPSTTNSILSSIPPSPVPAHSGQLRVTTLPTEAQGQWRLLWEAAWHNSGDTLTGLPTGNYPVEFSPIAGYLQPSVSTNPVTSGSLVIATNQYLVSGQADYGSLTVTIQPPSVAGATDVNSRGQWQLQGDGSNWHDSGFLLTNLVAGDHIVVFKPISGWVTPAPRVAFVGGSQQNSLATTYLVADQSGATPPSVLQFSDATSAAFGLPYAFNGQLLTDVGYGSGCVVQPRVVLTAGHMIFNDATLSYVQNINWFFQEYTGTYQPSAQVPAGSYVYAGYADARTTDNSPGVESPTAQNLDVAALFFLTDAGRGGSSGYLVSDPNGTGTQWLQASAQKTLVGYPVESVSQNNVGKMHATTPGNLAFSHVTNNVFSTAAIAGYPGNSGGPLCVQYTNGNYYPAAVYLGGSSQTIVRAIDGSVADLINRANVSANTGANNSGGGVVLLSSGLGGALMAPGYFQIVMNPPSAIAAGAGWKIAQLTNTFFTNNSTVFAASPTNYTVTFRAATGFITPSNLTLHVAAGQTATINITYAAVSGGSFTAARLIAGQIHLTLAALSGQNLALERSTNLVLWLPIITNQVSGSSISFTDAVPGNAKSMYYRVRLVP